MNKTQTSKIQYLLRPFLKLGTKASDFRCH